MTDTRAMSTSTNGNGTSSNAPSLPADLDNVTGLTTYVNTIFRQMEDKFMTASDQVMNRMTELGKKIDTLETNIGDIISHLPTDDSPASAGATMPQQQTKP